jgi:hypothetical protein
MYLTITYFRKDGEVEKVINLSFPDTLEADVDDGVADEEVPGQTVLPGFNIKS